MRSNSRRSCRPSGCVRSTWACSIPPNSLFVTASGSRPSSRNVLAVIAAGLTVVYPFIKRFVSIPQFVLGAAFGWAVPMAFAAQTGNVPQLAWLMFLATPFGVPLIKGEALGTLSLRDGALRLGST